MKQKYPKFFKSEHDGGYTFKEIKNLLTKSEYKSFEKWICGQTGTMNLKTKELLVYAWDVNRFIDIVRSGGIDVWD